MKNVNTGKIKPFKFIISDSVSISEFDNGIKYYKTYLSYFGQFDLGISNNTIYSKSGRVLGAFINLSGHTDVLFYPFGGHQIHLESVTYDKEYNDSLYVFSAKEVKTYDIEYDYNDSIELKKIIISKKRGFVELLIREKQTNELFIANSNICDLPDGADM